AGVIDGIESCRRPSWRDKADAVPDKVRKLVAVPGLHDALRHWLDKLADKTDRRGVVNLGGQLDRLALVACPEGRAVNPASIERILDRPLAALLGRTLRAGVLDEYGWPALEAARAALTSAATTARGEVEQI